MSIVAGNILSATAAHPFFRYDGRETPSTSASSPYIGFGVSAFVEQDPLGAFAARFIENKSPAKKVSELSGQVGTRSEGEWITAVNRTFGLFSKQPSGYSALSFEVYLAGRAFAGMQRATEFHDRGQEPIRGQFERHSETEVAMFGALAETLSIVHYLGSLLPDGTTGTLFELLLLDADELLSGKDLFGYGRNFKSEYGSTGATKELLLKKYFGERAVFDKLFMEKEYFGGYVKLGRTVAGMIRRTLAYKTSHDQCVRIAESVGTTSPSSSLEAFVAASLAGYVTIGDARKLFEDVIDETSYSGGVKILYSSLSTIVTASEFAFGKNSAEYAEVSAMAGDRLFDLAEQNPERASESERLYLMAAEFYSTRPPSRRTSQSFDARMAFLTGALNGLTRDNSPAFVKKLAAFHREFGAEMMNNDEHWREFFRLIVSIPKYATHLRQHREKLRGIVTRFLAPLRSDHIMLRLFELEMVTHLTKFVDARELLDMFEKRLRSLEERIAEEAALSRGRVDRELHLEAIRKIRDEDAREQEYREWLMAKIHRGEVTRPDEYDLYWLEQQIEQYIINHA